MNTINKQAVAYANLIELGVSMIEKAGTGKVSSRLSSTGDLGNIIAARMQMTINKKTEVYNDK